MDAGSHLLVEALDRAAQAAGAVLLASPEAGGLSWIVRLPRPEARHYLFAELLGAQVAVPWSRVVEYGLAAGSERPHILLGSGLGRIDLSIDWLFGKGEGRPVDAPDDAPAIAPPESFTTLGWVRDAEGRTARVLDISLGAETALQPGTGPSLEEPAAPPEAVQPEPIPADTVPETSAPARVSVRALVADDSMMARVFLGRLLAQRGIVVEEAEDGAAARALLDRGGFDLVFLDAEMPGAGAIEILQGADEDVVQRACVLVKDDEERRLAELFGGLPILYKPFAEDEVRSVVDRLRARTVRGT
jgi:CheY-like chemotaxis protein